MRPDTAERRPREGAAPRTAGEHVAASVPRGADVAPVLRRAARVLRGAAGQPGRASGDLVAAAGLVLEAARAGGGRS